jgi:protein-disulfide isomerase
MKNEPKKSSGIPLVIIILVFAGVVVGAYYLYTTRNPPANISNGITPRNSPKPTSTIPPNAPPGAAPANVLGSPTAAVVLEEFADFQCGSCGATHPVLKEIQSTYGSKIKLIFRNFPLPMHDKAYDAAVAAEAAGMQGKFWDMHNQLFTNQQTWSSPSANAKQLWTDYAQKIGVNVQQWQSDMAGLAAKSRVDLDISRGKAVGVSSTPSLYINGELIPFPEMNVAALRRIIDLKLQETSAGQSAAPAAAAAPASNTNK